MSVDFAQIAQENGVHDVIGNLPYNVSVPIIFKLAYCDYRFNHLWFMVQKEVGNRILAMPGTKDYGRLSIVLKYLFNIRKVRSIHPGAFFPPPKVESAFLEFTPKKETDLQFTKRFLERVVQIGFQHRRKKMRNQMKGAIVERRVFDEAFLAEAEKSFNLDQRAEEWDIETWIRFAEFVRNQKNIPCSS